jgi:CBS domain containing-hemolysin-like protein
MKTNMGSLDKTLRLVAAAVLAVLLILGLFKGTLAIVLAIVAAMFVITTLVGVCPAYVPFRISTKKRDKKSESCEV